MPRPGEAGELAAGIPADTKAAPQAVTTAGACFSTHPSARCSRVILHRRQGEVRSCRVRGLGDELLATCALQVMAPDCTLGILRRGGRDQRHTASPATNPAGRHSIGLGARCPCSYTLPGSFTRTERSRPFLVRDIQGKGPVSQAVGRAWNIQARRIRSLAQGMPGMNSVRILDGKAVAQFSATGISSAPHVHW